MLRINVSIADAQLSTVNSGARVEEIRQRVEEIEAIRGEIDALSRRKALSTYVSPLTGVLQHSVAADTLCVVNEVHESVLLMPLRLSEKEYLTEGAKVLVHGEHGAGDHTARLVSTGTDVQYLRGHAVTISTAAMSATPPALPRGLLVPCDIVCDDVSLSVYLVRWIQGFME